MTPELRIKLIKLASNAIGMCGSVKPEKQAEVAVDSVFGELEQDMNCQQLKKQYDYWLIVWIYENGEEVHQPACFQIAINPEEYISTVLSQIKVSKDPRSPKYKSGKAYRLMIEREIAARLP